MDEAANADINAYTCFNEFFTRELKAGIRPLAEPADSIISPADGMISQIGDISGGEIIQAKGKSYTVKNLLGGESEMAALFDQGKFATIYLSPKDYHRLHMPYSGTLRRMLHIPGRLFSVNGATANTVPNLFARNERVVCLFDTDIGPMALILVGAIFVASIETVWHGVVTPPTQKSIQSWDYNEQAAKLERGKEMGRFNMGSTIIVLFGQQAMQWHEALAAEKDIKLGQLLGLKS